MRLESDFSGNWPLESFDIAASRSSAIAKTKIRFGINQLK
jgi:hypothetical protein